MRPHKVVKLLGVAMAMSVSVYLMIALLPHGTEEEAEVELFASKYNLEALSGNGGFIHRTPPKTLKKEPNFNDVLQRQLNEVLRRGPAPSKCPAATSMLPSQLPYRFSNTSLPQGAGRANESLATVPILRSTTNNPLPIVAVCLPMTSRKSGGPRKLTDAVGSTPVMKFILPSLNRTCANNGTTYIVRTYVAIDHDDAYWLANLEYLQARVYRVIISQRTAGYIPLNVAPLNAYMDGADYLVRVNDDTSFDSRDWPEKGIAALQKLEPPNLGVVAPTCKQGNRVIFTHDMTHRTHLDIFGSYYPPELKSWWIDDWITFVYASNRARRLLEWTVVHEMSEGTRYAVDTKQASLLAPLVVCGRVLIDKFLNLYYPTSSAAPLTLSAKNGTAATAPGASANASQVALSTARPSGAQAAPRNASSPAGAPADPLAPGSAPRSSSSAALPAGAATAAAAAATPAASAAAAADATLASTAAATLASSATATPAAASATGARGPSTTPSIRLGSNATAPRL
jgi:hypothetical protein